MNTPITWTTDFGSIRILPDRGRVIGIRIGSHDALWSPVENSAPWNLGGERLWFGPEADWFWKQTERVDFEQYQVPPSLDPDMWTISQSDDTICAVRLKLHLGCPHADKTIDLEVGRCFELLPPEALAGSSPSLAFQTTTTLEILGGTHGQPVDLWSILQVPLGGEMVVPVSRRATPRDYFDPCPPGEISWHHGDFHLKIAGHSMFKIGLSPDPVCGLISYVRPVPGGVLALQRSFPIHPARNYCDSPLSDLRSQGDAAQFFCDDGTFGGFGEMEHHSPAIICGIGPQILTETTTTKVAILPTQK